MNTASKEYTQWVADIWRLNAERNEKIKLKQKKIDDEIAIAEIEAGVYE